MECVLVPPVKAKNGSTRLMPWVGIHGESIGLPATVTTAVFIQRMVPGCVASPKAISDLVFIPARLLGTSLGDGLLLGQAGILPSEHDGKAGQLIAESPLLL